MTTITINVENPSILPSLRKVFPNDTTVAAMEEVENGEDAGEVKLDNIDSFISSMM